MPAGHDGLFGRIALHLKFIDKKALRQAIEVHGRGDGKQRVGDILVDLGYLDTFQVKKVLSFQKQYQQKRERKAEQAKVEEAELEEVTPLAKVELEQVEAKNEEEKKVDVLLQAAVRYGASDVHIHMGHSATMRLQGKLVSGNGPVYSAEQTEADLLAILSSAQRESFLRTGDLGFAYEIPGVLRARAAYCRQQRGGMDGVFRLIPLELPTLESLRLPNDIARFATFHQGLVLFTGPTGCGKSTTMAGLLNLINTERNDHIITVEDPIEYVHPSKGCLVRQRQVVDHTQTFDHALRAALREDPDIIVVGELRDRETISLAISAAETGHLVYGTLHTNSAVRTINRILDVFPPDQAPQIRSMVSESLRGIVSQRLVPELNGKGRVPAIEILTVNLAVSNLIREGKTFQIGGLMQVGKSQGMCLLDDSLADYVGRGLISKEAARGLAEKSERFA